MCAMLLAPDGSLWAWGGSADWPLGLFLKQTNPPQRMPDVPCRIGSDSDWAQVSFGWDHVLALKIDGSLWAWGFELIKGEVRQTNLGNDLGILSRIGTETNWRQIRAAGSHNLALKNDGSLWTWGGNYYGQLGDGTTNSRPTPQMVGKEHDWQTIAAVGGTSFALKSNGTVWAWGKFYNRTNYLIPSQIDPGTNWLAISAFEGQGTTNSFITFTLAALKTDGTLWVNSSNVTRVASAFVPDLSGNFTQIGPDRDWAEIYAGMDSLFARKKDGSRWECGDNYWAQLGFGTNVTAVPAPRRLPFDFDPWAFASEDSGATLMLAKDGKLWTWGKRLGVDPPRKLRRKIGDYVGNHPSLVTWSPFVARTANSILYSTGLDFRSEYVIDQTPYLLWELPREVRHSLGTRQGSFTNDVNGGH